MLFISHTGFLFSHWFTYINILQYPTIRGTFMKCPVHKLLHQTDLVPFYASPRPYHPPQAPWWTARGAAWQNTHPGYGCEIRLAPREKCPASLWGRHGKH